MMFFEEITNQIIAFLKEKDFYFAKKNVLRHNENDGSVVIKVSKSEENYYIKGFTRRTMEEVLIETRFINLVSECGINVPQFVHIDGEQVFTCYFENINIVFYVMTELVGDTIIGKETYVDIASRIADLHNMKEKFQYLGQNNGKNDYQRLLEFMDDNRMFVADLLNCEQIKTMIEGHIPDDKFCLIHADLYMGNIVTRNGFFYGLIDFSDVRNGLPEDDFGKYLQNIVTGQLDYNEVKKIVEIYGKVRKDKVDFKEIYVSCIYRILYNLKCLYGNCRDVCFDEQLKRKYKEAINFCIMEYEKYE